MSTFAMGVAKYVPPPNVREEIIDAYAHCPDPLCEGVVQEPVKARKAITEWTFASRGGGDDPGGIGNVFLPMIENSTEALSFVNVDDENCERCGKRRDLSETERPVYPIVHGPNALLRLRELGLKFDPERQEQIQHGAKETPLELLQRRYINDEIDQADYQAKLGALSPGAALGAPVEDAETHLEVADLRTQLEAMQERDRLREQQIDKLLTALGEKPDPAGGTENTTAPAKPTPRRRA